MAETAVRIATFNTELAREGPGLLLRDALSSLDPQVEAVAEVVARSQPDVVLLQGVDYDHENLALFALRDRIEAHGWYFDYVFAAPPNTGMATGLDLDGDGKTGRPRDAQGYGEFAGQGGMAILSRYKILDDKTQDFSDLLWKDLPGALLLQEDGEPLMTSKVAGVQRLATVAHWVVPISVANKSMHLLAFHASPPVFDGPEDRNGRRNHDELIFWTQYMDGLHGKSPNQAFILVGDANLDPVDGEGRKSAIQRLLDDPRLQDPKPRRAQPVVQGADQRGDPALDTAFWPQPDPGHLRVSYVLPSIDLAVIGSGVFGEKADLELAETASRHRLIWVDVLLK